MSTNEVIEYGSRVSSPNSDPRLPLRKLATSLRIFHRAKFQFSTPRLHVDVWVLYRTKQFSMKKDVKT
ncbi:hypothetical protein K7X08_000961 [Anisodus acutangulus]|uniref:Uncharacterized protein n=1 Tax=Anisodus acutangulus TaxID=402998 RepID=A0A9Q1RN13_9SOLA|nr:hypothetical protein K7X08_000961 [Anisodus acutangulus]